MSAKCHFIIKAWPSWSNRFMWLFSSQHATIQYIWHIRRTPGDIHLSRGGRLQGFRFYQTLLTELILGGKKKRLIWLTDFVSTAQQRGTVPGLKVCVRAWGQQRPKETRPQSLSWVLTSARSFIPPRESLITAFARAEKQQEERNDR